MNVEVLKLKTCEMGLLTDYYDDGIFCDETPCDEIATHKVWWDDGDPLYLCDEHYEEVLDKESESCEIHGRE